MLSFRVVGMKLTIIHTGTIKSGLFMIHLSSIERQMGNTKFPPRHLFTVQVFLTLIILGNFGHIGKIVESVHLEVGLECWKMETFSSLTVRGSGGQGLPMAEVNI